MPEPTQLDCDIRPLYRVTFPIAYKDEIVEAGSLHRLEKVPAYGIERLKARGTIYEVNPPPLFVLPGWKKRAEKLTAAGIENAVQFLGVDVEQASTYMRVKPGTVSRWKAEVLKWLTAPAQRH